MRWFPVTLSGETSQMKTSIYLFVLVIAVAAAAWGVLVSLKHRQRTHEEYFTLFLLILVFSTFFGLYGLWVPAFMNYILAPAYEPDLPGFIPGFLNIMSLPFLLATWLTMLRVVHAINWRKLSWWLASAIILASLVLIVFSVLFPLNPLLPEWFPKSEFLAISILHLCFCFYSGIRLLFFRQEKSEWAESRPVFWLGFAFLLYGVMQVPAMAFRQSGFWTDALLQLLFFISLSIPLLVLVRSPLIRKQHVPASEEIKGFKSFCLKHEISPREAEVVLEICKGKSNREISDSLFISLQTVKDHAHNIFIKTGVKNRLQLANLVREN